MHGLPTKGSHSHKVSTTKKKRVLNFIKELHPVLANSWLDPYRYGGSNGTFSLEEAIPDIINTIEQKQGKPGLEFLDRFGKIIPW